MTGGAETTGPPEVSVLLSVRDGEPHLAEAIASLRAQTYEAFEVIAINDGSKDDSGRQLDEAAAADPRFRITHHPHALGLTASLNEAVAAARAPLIARLDADDLAAPDRFARQTAAFVSDPGLVLLGSDYRRIDGAGRPLGVVRAPRDDTAIRWTLLFHNAFCHSSVMFRAAAMDSDRPLYDPSWTYAQDYECWRHLSTRGRCANLGEPLTSLRIHDRQITAVHAEEQQALARSASLTALRQLDPQISPDEVDRLRAIFKDPGLRPSRAEWRRMADLLKRFGGEPGVDAATIRRIRWRMTASRMGRPVRRLWAGSKGPTR